MELFSVEPQPGDIIEIFHPDNKDWAIYVGDGDVIHLTPCSDEPPRTGLFNIPNLWTKTKATKEPLKDVAQGSVYRVHNHQDQKFRPQSVNEIITYAKWLVRNRVNYEFFIISYEKFVNDVRYGQIPRTLSSESPQPGDLIEISRKLWSHWAIYVGDGYVVHLPGSDLFSSMSNSNDETIRIFHGIVKCELLEAVVKRDKYRVNNYLDNKYRPKPIKEIVLLAAAKVGQTHYYKLLMSNSKHFATELRYGKGLCQQFSENPRPGDIIEIFHPDYKDWAIYLGDGDVIHLTPCSGDHTRSGLFYIFTNLWTKAEANKEALKNVAEGSVYRVHNHLDHKFRPQSVNEIITSAERLAHKRENYRVFFKTYEKFVNNLRYGQIPRPLSSEIPQPGDLIEIFRLGYNHWAVYVGDGYVVHLPVPDWLSISDSSSTGSFRDSNANVKRELLENVVNRDKYWVNNYLDNKYHPFPVELIVTLAEAKVGEIRFYHLLMANCKHFATELRYGVCRSQQLLENPQPGDIIEIFHPNYKDWGIYMGDGDVIHLTPCSGELSWSGLFYFFTNQWTKAKATKEHLKDKTEGSGLKVHNHLDHKFRPQSVNQIIACAEWQALNWQNYEFCSKNCEKFVNDLRYGHIPSPLSSESPQPGDLIEISREIWSHWAVYVGGGYVVHLARSDLSSYLSSINKAKSVRDSNGTVKRELLEALVNGDEYSVNNHFDHKYRPRPVQEIVWLAEAKVGETRFYHFLMSNCETFANELRYGSLKSQQSETAVSKLQKRVKLF